MAQFTLTIPDELLPALVAEFNIVSTAGATEAATPEDYFAASVIETVRQRAEIYRVGPYYSGPIPPHFNQDGTPYGAAVVEGPIEEPIEEPIVEPEVGE